MSTGPQTDAAKLMRLVNKRISELAPAIVEVLGDRAINGDRDCAIYMLDRFLGRPRQEIDQRLSAQILVTADDLLAARLAVASAEVALLEGVTIDGEYKFLPDPGAPVVEGTGDRTIQMSAVVPILSQQM